MTLDKDLDSIIELNMYNSRNCVTPSGQHLGEDYNADKLYYQLKEKVKFDQKKKEIAEFNSKNKFKKRGISLSGGKYGLAQSYTAGTPALVNINGSDGTVVVFHGGLEIGQGIHTKVAQMVAQTLECPLDKVRIGDSNSDVTVRCFLN